MVRMEDEEESHNRRELLSRRPSYRKIFSEISSDSPAVSKIDNEDEEAVTVDQSSAGQHIAIAEGRAVPQSVTGAEALPRVQMVRVAGSPAPKSSTAVPQCTGDSAQQFFLQGGQLLLQGRSCFITAGFNVCVQNTTQTMLAFEWLSRSERSAALLASQTGDILLILAVCLQPPDKSRCLPHVVQCLAGGCSRSPGRCLCGVCDITEG